MNSEVKIYFKDKAEWTVEILEVSDLNNFITYEVTDTDSPIKPSSIMVTIKLQRVTDVNHTFITWVFIFIIIYQIYF